MRKIVRRTPGALRAAAVVLGLLILVAPSGCSKQDKAPVATVATSPPPVEAPPGKAGNLETAIERVAERTIPAVVHIEVTERTTVPNPLLPFSEDPFFRYFFGNRRMPRKFQRVLRGLGTGMLMDEQGFILTNNHVAGGATRIDVQLADGERYPATLVGADPKTDLAVIRIRAGRKLPYVVFGDSDRVRVGEWVVAIGHPRGLDQTVTQGIISAKHRTGITDPTDYQDFLQTDAAINPGNSGGPLLNLAGEVIGVNAAIESTSGGFQGIGFAIPSDMALSIAKQLIATGKVERGWLGITIRDLTPALARSTGIKERRGALVADIVAQGPAAKAGLMPGDAVVSFAGKPVESASDLRNRASEAAVGSTVPLTVLRDGKELSLNVTVGGFEEATRLLAASAGQRLGATFRTMTAKTAAKYGLDPGHGVELLKIDGNGPLGKAGFEAGDLILAVNGQPVAGAPDFDALVGGLHPGQKVALLAVDHRSGQEGTVEVTAR
ncbi:MAG: trypsin-like peptidase domain-containing protein [Gemmatimonadota bacterium]